MSDRETFFQNDIPIIVYEARRPNPAVFSDPDGVPAQPTDVEARFYSGTDGAFVLVDGSDVVHLGAEGSNLYMVPMDEEEDRGALIYVKVPLDVTENNGNYTLYLTTIYADGLRITHDERVQISEYR